MLFYSMMAVTKGMAQQAYPLPPVAPANITRLEYFLDEDPGVGKGKQVVLAPSPSLSSFSFDADITGLPNGFHRLYVRVLDANGHWSLTSEVYFDNVVITAYPVAPAPAVNIVQAEYFIDNDPGEGKGQPIPVLPGTNLNNQPFAVSLSGLATGVHRLYVRSQDASGQWSLTNFAQFDNSASVPYPTAPPAAPDIGEIEYYIDTDPGLGNGIPVTFTGGLDITNLTIDIPLNTVAPGAHTIYFRSRQNPWSLSAYADFIYASPLPVTWLYVRGSMDNGKTVLSWATASEQNTNNFIVEYSTNGTQFNAIGEVAAAGNSSSSKTYSWVHEAPGRGFLFYRIRQVDIDGQFTYSKIIQLFNGAQLKTTVIGPNPVQHTIHIVEPEPVLVKKIELFDVSGRRVLSKRMETICKNYSLELGKIATGTYLLTIHYQDRVQTFRIVRQ